MFFFFFFNDTATTEIYTSVHTLSLHDALPISPRARRGSGRAGRPVRPLDHGLSSGGGRVAGRRGGRGQSPRHHRPCAGHYFGAGRAGRRRAAAAARRPQGPGPVRAAGRRVSPAGAGGVPPRAGSRGRPPRRDTIEASRPGRCLARSPGGGATLNTRGLMKLRKTLVLVAVAGVALATGGWLLQREAAPVGSVYQQARLFEDVLAHVADYYVDSIDERQLYQMAIDGMLDQLHDP